MFTARAKPVRIIVGSDNQRPDKWSSAVYAALTLQVVSNLRHCSPSRILVMLLTWRGGHQACDRHVLCNSPYCSKTWVTLPDSCKWHSIAAPLAHCGGGISPPILNLGSRLRRVATLPLRKGSTLSVECESGWAPGEGVDVLGESCSCRESNHGSSEYAKAIQKVRTVWL